ncbi:MAG TPA: glycoside hydrolase family 57 protein, partial [Candidatus Polarisedimenticolia bacterium]|nr:glycoside hydrolase family 57 protein [Candidatus Polarisedimenticolia bacterium]
MKPVSVAFLWHLHQPLYRLRGERTAVMPWVRLHAIRSYYDMVRLLDEFPAVQVTMNLVPTLIEQIRAYEAGGSDLFWDAGAVPAEDLDEEQRIFLFDHFFSAQDARMIGSLPRYAELLARRRRARRAHGPKDAWKEFTDADFRDLQALFDLAWFGFKALEDFPALAALARGGQAYTQENIREIHAVEREILRRLLPLYRDAATRRQIEISTSPYAHPILPLLIDSDAARESLPEAPLPQRFRAPEDARAQVEEALDLVERELGVRPRGLWPSEGSLSQETAELLAACGVAWAASDDGVLRESVLDEPADHRRPWLPAGPARAPWLIFRDHDLSDRIGFTYARLDPEAAAADFLGAVVQRAGEGEDRGGILLIALDGENPWEHYPRAGADFLRILYGSLLKTPSVACRSVSSALSEGPAPGTIRRLRAGSWIDASLATWIGGPEKNRAWSVLGRTRAAVGAALKDTTLPGDRRREAWASLRAAEGSDWFWWLDAQFSSIYRPQFDALFRGHLRQVYEALGRDLPDELNWPIRSPERRSDEAIAETSAWLLPEIDGFEGSLFEWLGAVRLAWSSLSAPGAMQRAVRPVESLWFGFSEEGEFLLRLDPARHAEAPGFARFGIDLSFRVAGQTRQLLVDLDDRGDLRLA